MYLHRQSVVVASIFFGSTFGRFWAPLEDRKVHVTPLTSYGPLHASSGPTPSQRSPAGGQQRIWSRLAMWIDVSDTVGGGWRWLRWLVGEMVEPSCHQWIDPPTALPRTLVPPLAATTTPSNPLNLVWVAKPTP